MLAVPSTEPSLGTLLVPLLADISVLGSSSPILPEEAVPHAVEACSLLLPGRRKSSSFELEESTFDLLNLHCFLNTLDLLLVCKTHRVTEFADLIILEPRIGDAREPS
uniref:Uncharacterized protein n=1 Tax=Arundo donax TaxID=35708 RepID=A0A0A9E2V4_ARUDO